MKTEQREDKTLALRIKLTEQEAKECWHDLEEAKSGPSPSNSGGKMALQTP